MIKLNKSLISDVNHDPTKDSQQMSIESLCEKIENSQMTLPIFQTYIRWDINKAVDLLNFQLKGMAPVSPISINLINNRSKAIQQISFIDRELIDISGDRSILSVIDGQQRLSCNYKSYTNHEDFKCIVLDITFGEFRVNTEAVKKNQIPVGILYNKDISVFKNYLKDHKSLQEFDVHDLLTGIRKKFMKYDYTLNYAKDLNENEQLEWFEVLNLAGSRVPANQVFLTEMLVKGVDFYKEFSDKYSEYLYNSDLDSLLNRKSIEISIPLAGLNAAYEVLANKAHSSNFSPIPSDAKGTFMSNLEDFQLRQMFEMVLKALENVISFIEENNLKKPDRIDYITYLTGAYVYIGHKNVTDAQKEYLIKWYNEVTFDSAGNSKRRKIFDDLILVKDIT